ncbi:Plasmodium exported protein (PHISTc), unknown function [Plasmodium reichenowi]|uniref:Plasmodium RESA N-terminal domain-containing protein n=1 Tax=Plasmodium reichenowi TaxID=5854 RepID=A0A060RX59_PLARE|nr:Plasmodium exported protein (PHISTc), unknown function [Plasmodium reichenowi]
MEYLKKTSFISEKNKLWMKKERQYKKYRSRNYIVYRCLIVSLFIFYLIIQLRYENSGENTYNCNDSIMRNRDSRILYEFLSNSYEYDHYNDYVNVEEFNDFSNDILEDFSISSNNVNDYDNIDENVNLMSFIEVTEVLNDDQNTPPESNVDCVVSELDDDIIDEEEDKRLKEAYEKILRKRRGISGRHPYHILISSLNEFNSNNIINEEELDLVELIQNEMDSNSYNVLTEEDVQNNNSSYNNEELNNNNISSTSENNVNTYELPNEELHNNSDRLNGADVVNMNLYFNGDMYSSLGNLEETVETINEEHQDNEDDEEEFEKMLNELKNNGSLGETCKIWNKLCFIENKKFYNMQMNLWNFCEILAFEYKIPQSILTNEWEKIVTYTNKELIQQNLTNFSDFNTLVFNKIYDALDFIEFIKHTRESWKQFRESEERVWKNTLEKNFKNYVG